MVRKKRTNARKKTTKKRRGRKKRVLSEEEIRELRETPKLEDFKKRGLILPTMAMPIPMYNMYAVAKTHHRGRAMKLCEKILPPDELSSLKHSLAGRGLSIKKGGRHMATYVNVLESYSKLHNLNIDVEHVEGVGNLLWGYGENKQGWRLLAKYRKQTRPYGQRKKMVAEVIEKVEALHDRGV